MTPAWGLSAIAWILEFCGAKIRAKKKREKAAKLRAERERKKKYRAAAAEIRALEKAREEYARQAESKRINAENAAKIEAMRVPVDDNPYGDE